VTERLRVNEIFYSIQGESSWAGRPCVFVRLTGCNLRCRWCDTEYAFYEGAQLPVPEIVARVREYGCNLVEITGGEPMLQKGIHALIDTLLEEGFTVMLETSGERDLRGVDSRVVKIMDLKCPGSGESERNRWTNVDILAPHDEVKFVIADRGDYEWARSAITDHHISDKVRSVLMSPVHGEIAPDVLASWILEDGLPVRLQLQMHKQIWPSRTRGV
jgi:7-carboxy-7-deazaguanine synthase